MLKRLLASLFPPISYETARRCQRCDAVQAPTRLCVKCGGVGLIPLKRLTDVQAASITHLTAKLARYEGMEVGRGKARIEAEPEVRGWDPRRRLKAAARG